MRRIAILGLLAAVFSAPALGNEIRWKPETLTPGDYVVIHQSQNGYIHHVFRGKIGPHYVIESYRGLVPSSTPEFTTFLDKDGNDVKFVRQDGQYLTFSPHDCKRTLGRCQYTQTFMDGRTEERLRITEATRRGMRYSEYDADGKRLFEGRVALDARGNGGDGVMYGYRGKQRFRLVSTVYQDEQGD